MRDEFNVSFRICCNNISTCDLFNQAELAEEERLDKVQSRTTGTKVKLYTLRIFISFLVMVLLGGAIYAIYLTVEVSTDPVSISHAWSMLSAHYSFKYHSLAWICYSGLL